MAEQPGEVEAVVDQSDKDEESPDAGESKERGKMIVFAVAIIPLIAAMSFFLVVKVINPRFAPFASADAVDGQLEAEADDTSRNGFICELGTVLVNPAGGKNIRIMKIGVSIEVMTKVLLKKVEMLKARLQHQLIMVLSSKQLDEISSSKGKALLQNELRNIFAAELDVSPADVRQVYFGEFIIQ